MSENIDVDPFCVVETINIVVQNGLVNLPYIRESAFLWTALFPWYPMKVFHSPVAFTNDVPPRTIIEHSVPLGTRAEG